MVKLSGLLRELIVILTTVLVVAGTPNVFSQEVEKKIKSKDLPALVMSAFQKAYPKAKITGTSEEREHGVTYYEIESVDGKTRRNLLYMADGKVVEIEETIPMSALPPEVKNSLDKEFPKAKIEKAEKVTRDSVVTYEIKVKLRKTKKEVVLDDTGKVLRGKK